MKVAVLSNCATQAGHKSGHSSISFHPMLIRPELFPLFPPTLAPLPPIQWGSLRPPTFFLPLGALLGPRGGRGPLGFLPFKILIFLARKGVHARIVRSIRRGPLFCLLKGPKIAKNPQREGRGPLFLQEATRAGLL